MGLILLHIDRGTSTSNVIKNVSIYKKEKVRKRKTSRPLYALFASIHKKIIIAILRSPLSLTYFRKQKVNFSVSLSLSFSLKKKGNIQVDQNYYATLYTLNLYTQIKLYSRGFECDALPFLVIIIINYII